MDHSESSKKNQGEGIEGSAQKNSEAEIIKAQLEELKLISRKEKTYLENIFRIIPTAVFLTDRNRIVIGWNKRAQEITGYAPEEIIGKKCTFFAEAPCSEKCGAFTDSVVKPVMNKECTIRRKDGRMLVVSKSVEIIKDDQGITVAGVEVFEDITVRKQADQALQSSHQNLEMQMRYRTEQLSKINQMLIVEISEREKVQESIRMGNEKLKRVLTETISALASTVEKRDPYTAGHQERVAQLVLAIAKELNLPEEKIEGVKTAAMIHDIGKICVPAEILSKPSRLTSHEFSLITEHPQVGYDILKGIEFPWPVAKIVVQHHERLDGSGYPNKLKGDQILLEAWILIVSDVVEAMASHRPYRPALGVERALDEILSKKGILYLPSVVDACINIFLRKGFQFK